MIWTNVNFYWGIDESSKLLIYCYTWKASLWNSTGNAGWMKSLWTIFIGNDQFLDSNNPILFCKMILNDYNTIFHSQYELKFKNLWPTTVKIFDKYIWWKLYIKCVSKRSCWNRWTLNSPAEFQLKFAHLYISLKFGFSLVF